LSAWAGRYLKTERIEAKTEAAETSAVELGNVMVRELDKKFTREILTHQHRLISDEPIAMGGANLGFNPYELLLAALGSCTSMTLRMYANHKQIDLQEIRVVLHHNRIHAEDCANCDKSTPTTDKIIRKIQLIGNLDEQQRARLLEIANQCPVHKTLKSRIEVETTLAESL
jgi:putative redox protein